MYKRYKKFLSAVSLAAAFLAVQPATARGPVPQAGGTEPAGLPSDTLSIRFQLDSIRIDMSYGGNADMWSAFERRFRERYAGLPPRQLRLDIYSGASPEGPAARNRWLGENRGQAIRRLIHRRLGTDIGSIAVHNEAARWDALYESVAAGSEPWRDEVLAILDEPASSDESRLDRRELKLRALRDGQVWPVLLDRYLAPLRSGATAVLSWQRDTVLVRDTVVVVSDCPPVAVPSPPARPEKQPLRHPVWILRTNLPLLGIGTPNLQAEYPLGRSDRWSVNVEGAWSWWTFSYNKFANQILYGSAELRRWLGNRRCHHTLCGWHVGLAVGGGYGDLEWKSRGYQGEVYSCFVNIGWQQRFGRTRRWAFDAGVGLGYAHVTWRRYTGSRLYPVGREEVHDDHLMWRETGRTNWIGTPHVNISLGYVFPLSPKRQQKNNDDAQ